MGRWIVAATLWALAGGLFAGRTIATHADRCVETGMEWLAVQGPSFLRRWLPEPVPKLIEPRARRQAVASPPPADAPPSKETTHTAAREGRQHRHR